MRWRYEKWVKLYVREEGTFSQLPLYVRALAGELLKICDQHGRIALRGKQPWEAVAFQLGADPSDRRLLRKHIPMLVADGYLEVSGADMFVRNFTVAQTGTDRVRTDLDMPSEHESDASRARTEHEPCTSEARAVHEPCTTEEPSNDNQTGLSRRSDIEDIQDLEEKKLRAASPAAPVLVLVPTGPVRKPKKQPAGEHQQTIDAFDTAYKAQNSGASPTWNAKTGKAVSALLKAHGGPEVRRRIAIMFTSGPAWLAPPFDIATLVQHFDKLARPSATRVGPKQGVAVGRVEPHAEYPDGEVVL